MAIDLGPLQPLYDAYVIPVLPKIWGVLLTLIIGYFIIKLVVRIVEKFFDKVDFDRGMETFIENIVATGMWILLIIIILANLGVDVSAMIAGLGIAGFVIGFALKDTLGNLASGVFILFNKPFSVGHYVHVAGVKGTVERVGVASCQFKAADGTKITIPNNKIWGDVIENYSGNRTRKLYNLEVGIAYDADMDKAIKIISKILTKDERVLKDPEPQIVVKSLGDSAVVISARPSVKKDDYWGVYFDSTKKIKEEFDKAGIGIPFPQQDVWIKEMPKK